MSKNIQVINVFDNNPEKYDLLVSKEDYQNNLLNALNEIVELENKSIIEFGAGTGRLTFKLSNYAKEIFAFEYLQSLLNIALGKKDANKINNCILTLGDNLNPPEITKEYDIAIGGWSFLATIAFLDKGWDYHNAVKILKTILRHNSIMSFCASAP